MKSEAKHKAKKAFWSSMDPIARHLELSRRAKKAWARRSKEYKQERAAKMVQARLAKKLIQP